MNKFFVAALLSLLACALAAAEKECCTWPFPSAGRTFVKNITADTFECNEPIQFTCQKMSRFKTHGILGDVRNPMKDKLADKVILHTQKHDVNAIAYCDTTSRLWTLEGHFTAHAWFSCGVQLDDGTWISN